MGNSHTFYAEKPANPLFTKASQLIAAGIGFVIFYSVLTAVFAPWYRVDLTIQTNTEQRVKIYFATQHRVPVFTETQSLSLDALPSPLCKSLFSNTHHAQSAYSG